MRTDHHSVGFLTDKIFLFSYKIRFIPDGCFHNTDFQDTVQLLLMCYQVLVILKKQSFTTFKSEVEIY